MQTNENNTSPQQNEIEENEISMSQEIKEQELIEDHETEEYSGLGKVELIKMLEEVIAGGERSSGRINLQAIKELFVELSREEVENKKKEFINDGEKEEDFFLEKNPLDDEFESLLKKIHSQRHQQKKEKEKSLNDNLLLKQHIIEELKVLMKGGDNLSKAFQKFQALQSKWRETGNVPSQEANNLWQTYQFLTEKFFDAVKINKELRDLDLKKNLELKTELCEKAEKLMDEPSINKSMEAVKILQDKWKEIGSVAKESNDKIWERFKNATEPLFERKRLHLIQVRKKQEENLVSKKALCERIELMVAELNVNSHKQWQEESEKVAGLFSEWQKIGYVPKEDKGMTWKRFQNAQHKFHESREGFYSKSREDQTHNLELKTALCIEAEALQDNTDWNSTTETLKKLQVRWKTIGAAPRKYSDKVWNRFRAACDKFFENKAKHQAEQDQHLVMNVHIREKFISRIENLELSDDNKLNVEELRKLQAEWLTLGEIPYKQKETINISYRNTVDKVMEGLKTKTGGSHFLFKLKYEQLLQTTQGKEQITRERFQLQDKIKKIQADVTQLENNLSFFGKSKNADVMKLEFQEKIDIGKAEIKSLNDQLKMIPNPNPVIAEPLPDKKSKGGARRNY